MTPDMVQKKYESLIKRRDKIRDELNKFQKEVKNICPHPAKHMTNSHGSYDDGYGRCTHYNEDYCGICGATFDRRYTDKYNH